MTINTAVEETTLGARKRQVLGHDKLCSEYVGKEDVVICSVGGNDIALRPSPTTQQKLVQLLSASPQDLQEGKTDALEYFVDMFKNRIEDYLTRVVGKNMPSKILVCMIYYPAEKSTGQAGGLEKVAKRITFCV